MIGSASAADAARARHEPGAGHRIPNRTQDLADAMRMLAARDGSATAEALMAEGFTRQELVDLGFEAAQIAGLTFAREGRRKDTLPDVIRKAREAVSHDAPDMAGCDPAQRPAQIERWQAYSRAVAAYRIDPWLSQRERALVLLDRFLKGLPILDRERKRTIAAVFASMIECERNRR